MKDEDRVVTIKLFMGDDYIFCISPISDPMRDFSQCVEHLKNCAVPLANAWIREDVRRELVHENKISGEEK